MEKNTFKVLIKKSQSGYIAKTVDYSFIAQGSSVDLALQCLLRSLDIQYEYDLKNGIVPWSKHLEKVKSPNKIFESHKKFKSDDFFLENAKKGVALELAHC